VSVDCVFLVGAFPPKSSQEEVYNQSVHPSLCRLLQSQGVFRCSVLAYGATGSGKTVRPAWFKGTSCQLVVSCRFMRNPRLLQYTMLGEAAKPDDAHSEGIVSRPGRTSSVTSSVSQSRSLPGYSDFRASIQGRSRAAGRSQPAVATAPRTRSASRRARACGRGEMQGKLRVANTVFITATGVVLVFRDLQ